jgi:hypothetical protein
LKQKERKNPGEDPEEAPVEAVLPREPGDDFFCLRFGVWYASYDCALRTKFRTCGGCRDCEQGRFNLRRHEVALRLVRWGPAQRG